MAAIQTLTAIRTATIAQQTIPTAVRQTPTATLIAARAVRRQQVAAAATARTVLPTTTKTAPV
jgi:hypothetical protein